MNQEKLVADFTRELDDILDRKSKRGTADVPPKYEGALKLAFDLSRMDFSRDGWARERIWRRLMNHRPGEDSGRYSKEAVMNRIFKGRRLALALGTFAIMTLVGFGLAFPGVMTALADNIGENVSKVLKLGPFTTVMQVKGDPTPVENVLTPEEQAQLEKEGTITKQIADGREIKISVSTTTNIGEHPEGTVSYPSPDEAQKAVCFKVLTPGYLPSGYSFKEAVAYEGSDQYINLYFKGPGEDIVLMQRIMNEETRYGFGTNGPVESVEINGAPGAWVGPNTTIWERDGVNYSLFTSGLSKEEALKIAGSIK